MNKCLACKNSNINIALHIFNVLFCKICMYNIYDRENAKRVIIIFYKWLSIQFKEANKDSEIYLKELNEL